jgi:Domain of unknown function DUF29
VQADLLRRRRFADLDLEHVVEEIEDAGGSLYREVRPRIRTIMEHVVALAWIPLSVIDLRLTPECRPRTFTAAREPARNCSTS